jgi:hypothetical protein
MSKEKDVHDSKEGSGDQLRYELAQEFKSLRSIFRDILSSYQANIEADMAACVNLLSTHNLDELPKSAKHMKALRTMLHELQELNVKPRKGRLKDVRRVDEAVASIYTQLFTE